MLFSQKVSDSERRALSKIPKFPNNFEEIKKVKDIKGVDFVVSGGVGSFIDILKINEEVPFVFGVIVGKALYEKRIELERVISSLKQ